MIRTFTSKVLNSVELYKNYFKKTITTIFILTVLIETKTAKFSRYFPLGSIVMAISSHCNDIKYTKRHSNIIDIINCSQYMKYTSHHVQQY